MKRNQIKKLFLFHMYGVKKITQNTIHNTFRENKKNNGLYKKYFLEQTTHSYLFKNTFSEKSFFLCYDPICFMRYKNCNIDFKKLKKGEYIPEIVLDLHGASLTKANQELGKLIAICHKEKFFCAHIIHGYGKKILKKYVPYWLSNHPDVLAFHQAPKSLGYDAAILIFLQCNFER